VTHEERISELERELSAAREETKRWMTETDRIKAELKRRSLSAVQAVTALVMEREAAELRPEVLAFAKLMEKKLRQNDHKGGWQREDPDYILKRLREEVEEIAAYGGHLVGAQIRHLEHPDDPQQKSSKADSIGEECADVANFAMMIADNSGALKGLR
jgi:NTP pyrophosphatase (non-canonical NTP hydrolase)